MQQGGGGKPVRMHRCIRNYKVVVFRHGQIQKHNLNAVEKGSTSTLSVVVYSWAKQNVFCCWFQRWGSTLQIPQAASPGDARKRQSKRASATTSYSGELFSPPFFLLLFLPPDNLLFDCLVSASFLSPPETCIFKPRRVAGSCDGGVRIADGEREGCLNAARRPPKLWVLPPDSPTPPSAAYAVSREEKPRP